MKIPRVYVQDGRYYYVEDLQERHPKTGRPKQKWHKLTRVDEGEAALLAALADFLGTGAERKGNLPRLVDEFRKVHLPGLSFDVRKEYGRMYDVIATAFQKFDAAQVTPGDVVKFLVDNFTGKPTAKGHYKARISTFFSWCVMNSHTGVDVNPCREIRLSGPPRRKGRMNDTNFHQLRDALTPMGQCFLDLTYLTRQRPTEIRLLRESHIGKERIRFVPSKTEHSSGEEVEILITPEIAAALDRARGLRAKKKVEQLDRRRDPFIIQTREGGGYSKNGLYEVWRDACQAAKVKGVTTRDIRPYALHTMEKMGFTVREIQTAAAHSIMATTEGYLEQHRERFSDARLRLPEKKA